MGRNSPAKALPRVNVYVRKAKIGKTGGCHLFRRTVATLMLENGADIRVIPEIEDGFRTIGEQQDRRKRYPTTAAKGLSWHEVGDRHRRSAALQPRKVHRL
jgi:integrase